MAFINFSNPLADLNNLLFSTNDPTDVINGFGGIDTVSYINATSGVDVRLSIAGFQNTVGSAIDSLISIENLTGSNFNDTLGGDAGDNVLDGGAGIDTVHYGAAQSGVNVSLSITVPQITGGAGRDTLLNFENLIGSRFNDTLSGNAGNNILNGGDGVDTISYRNATAAVAVSLSLAGPQLTGGAGTDTLIAFENLTGSNFNDRLTGDAGNNMICGGIGNDTLIGTIGNDTLDGEGGFDMADYSTLGKPVTLGAFGVLDKGSHGVDRLVNVESICGSSGVGDTIDLRAISSPGVSSMTNLNAGTIRVLGTPPLPLSFNIRGFENVIGSDFTDTIVGDQFANALRGGRGGDLLNGLEGNDVLLGEDGNDTLIGGFGDDFLAGGTGTDTLSDSSGSDIFSFASASDSVVGPLRDVIIGFKTGSAATGGDFLRLADMDANMRTTGANEAFTSLIFSSVFTANQQLRYTIKEGNLHLFGNCDGNNATAEFEIQINGLVGGITFANIIA